MEPEREAGLREFISNLDGVIAQCHEKKPFALSDEELTQIYLVIDELADKLRTVDNIFENLECAEKLRREIEQQKKPDVTNRVSVRAANYCHEVKPKVPFDVENIVGIQMTKFLYHDISHLHMYMQNLPVISAAIVHSAILKLSGDKKYREYFDSVNAVSKAVLPQYEHPFQIAKWTALKELGERMPMQEVDLEQLIGNVVLGIRGRALAVALNAPGLEVEFIQDLDVKSIYAIPAMIWSICYNNIKNSEKKIVEVDPRRKGHYTISVSTKDIDDNYMLLAFSDSGEPVSLDTFKNLASAMFLQGEIGRFPLKQTMEKMQAWMQNPFAVNQLTYRDMTSFAFVAKLSGNPNSITSGMGLWGTEYCLNELGGAIIIGEQMDGNHPIFGYVLPKKPVEVSKAEEIAEEMTQRELVRI